VNPACRLDCHRLAVRLPPLFDSGIVATFRHVWKAGQTFSTMCLWQRALHIPPKWKPVRREEYAQEIDFARILIDRMIPSDRKAR
jgi:hypothetical protein